MYAVQSWVFARLVWLLSCIRCYCDMPHKDCLGLVRIKLKAVVIAPFKVAGRHAATVGPVSDVTVTECSVLVAVQVKIKAPKKKLSNKEKKQRERVRKAKIARGEEVSDSEEDE